jgi:antitoxin MazE
MRVTVSQWGNSLGLRLPKAIASQLMLSPGSRLDLQVEEGRLIASPVMSAPVLAVLLAGITSANRHAPLMDDAPSVMRRRGQEAW